MGAGHETADVLFSVLVIDGPVTYQWYKDGVPLSNAGHLFGANEAAMSIGPIEPTDAGSYDCVVSNGCHETISTAATLTVDPATTIATEPVGGSICQGGTFTFSVTAEGTGPFTYQWFKVFTPVGNGDTHTITDATPADAGDYTVQITGACGTVTSSPATLTVRQFITVGISAPGSTVCTGASLTFTATPSGTGPFTYQWFHDSGSGGVLVSTAGPTYTIASAAPGDAGAYYVLATGFCNTASSLSLPLTVEPATSITDQPDPLSVCDGSSASFTVTATGDALTYRWRKLGVPLFEGGNLYGVETPTLTINPVNPSDAATYDCEVTGACGSVVSTSAALTVNNLTVVTGPTGGGSYCPGATVTLEVLAGGTGPFTYQWFRGATPVGANSPTLVIPGATPANSGGYSVTVTGACGPVTTTPAIVTVSDTDAPVPNAPELSPVTAECTYEVLQPYPTAMDNCAGAIAGVPSHTLFTGEGVYTLTWTYTDPSGNSVTQDQMVVIDDVTQPQVTTGSIAECYPSAAQAEAAAIAATTATDTCLGPVTLSAVTVGDCLANIFVTADDGHGNTATVQYTTVIDNQAPTISCPADVTVSAAAGPVFVFVPLASATDNCGGTPVITNSYNDGGSDASGLYPAGVTHVTFAAVDPCGNTSSCTVTITVNTCAAPTTAYVDDDYTDLPDGTTVTWPFAGGTGSYIIGCDAFATIQAGLDAVVASTVYVAAGDYTEDLTISLNGTNLFGSGAAVTVVHGTMNDATGTTVRINASNVTVTGFTITRDGNNTADWNNNLNTAGVAIQGTAFTNALIAQCVITGNRTGIDLNNTSGHTIRNNVIDFNRTGVILRNMTDTTEFTENFITNNWTVGVLFIDGSGGTNSPVQSFSGAVHNNSISGNWYAQVEDRQSGGSLPAPGTTNLKNFSGNWLGSVSPVISTAQGGEPGYATQIPVAFGGSATPPGGQPDVKGSAVDNFDITPYLHVATDTDVSTGYGTFGFQGEFKELHVTSELAQTGSTPTPPGRIQEGHDAVAEVSGAAVYVSTGKFTENVTVTKTLRIDGSGSGSGGSSCPTADPLTQTVVTAAAPNQPVILISAVSDVVLTQMYITGASGSTDSTAAGVRVRTDTGGSYSDYHFGSLTVSGNSGPGLAFDGEGSINSVEVPNCTFCTNRTGVLVDDDMQVFSGLELDQCYVADNAFNGLSVTGAADGSHTPTGIRVSECTFSHNGQSSDAFQGSGDISLYQFNGKADILNTVIQTVGRFPIQLRGAGNPLAPATWLPIGEVSLHNVIVSGAADRAAVTVHVYADVDQLTLNNLDCSGMVNTNPPFTGFSVTTLTLSHAGATPLPLANTVFACQGPGYVGLGNFFTGGAAADCTTLFGPGATLADKEACVFDFNDYPAVGDVTFPDAHIVSNPVGGTFCYDATTVLSVVAGGAGPFTYQWYHNGDPIDDGGAYSGVTTPDLTVMFVSDFTDGSYTVVVTNACSSATSSAAVLDTSDSEPPSITCGSDQGAFADAVACTAPVPDFTASAIYSDNCAVINVAQSPPAGTLLGTGVWPVTVTVSDAHANQNSCTAYFTVTDNTPPVISICAPDLGAFADASCSALVPDFTASVSASDACGGVTVSQSPPSGTPVTLGTHPITITVTDDAGNSSTCDASFTVTDGTPPSISSCAPDLSLVATGPNCKAMLPDLTTLVLAGDNCDAAVVVTQDPIAGTLLAVGAHTITFTVTDDAGNFSTCDTLVTVTAPSVLFVDKDATGANDGSSWADAYTKLQNAIVALDCLGSGEIWVAEGTYYPDDATGTRGFSFRLESGIAIYGGFNATETLLSQRDPDANPTVLSGDIGVPGDASDNTFNVVTASGVDTTAILDGFTVTLGAASTPAHGQGAGLYSIGGSPTIANCLFTNNYAFGGGAAVYTENGSPSFIRCTFLANTGVDGGGALRSMQSTVDLVNCRVLGNTSGLGAIQSLALSDVSMVNCEVSGNIGTDAVGGLVASGGSLLTLTNCTVANNTAPAYPGIRATGPDTQIVVNNSILWGNTDTVASETAQISALPPATISVSYSDIQGLSTIPGPGNIGADPLFTDADGLDNTFGTLDDNLRPLAGSPVVDAAANPALPADAYDLDADADSSEELPVDLDSTPRRLDDAGTPDTGLGSAPIVDMGAYEFDCLSTDCNDNGVCDSVDIALGSATDCFDPSAPPNGGGFFVAGGPDGIPDECQCVADWNRDGVVNSTDVSDFINTYFDDQSNSTNNGDINCNGISNSTDVSDFINIWFEVQAGLRPHSGCTI